MVQVDKEGREMFCMKKPVSVMLCGLMLTLSLVPAARCAEIPSEPGTKTEGIAALGSSLALKRALAERLVTFGLTPAEVGEALEKMSAEQLQTVQQHIDVLVAAGDDSEALGTIFGVALMIFLVAVVFGGAMAATGNL